MKRLPLANDDINYRHLWKHCRPALKYFRMTVKNPRRLKLTFIPVVQFSSPVDVGLRWNRLIVT